MLRSLGSTLVAKTGPGSALRTADEERKQGAVSQNNQSAQPQNVERQTVAQPLEVQVPEGSQKVVSVQPLIEPRLEPGAEPGPGLLPQIGGASEAAVTGRSINASPGAPSATPITSRPAVARSVAAPSKGGTQAAAYRPTPTPTPTPGPSNSVQNAQNQRYESTGFLGSLGLGGRVAAGERNTQPVQVSPIKAIEGKVGKAIDVVGGALSKVGIKGPELKLSEKAQSVGPQQVRQGSSTPPAQNIIRSVQGAISNAGNFLRSLTNKKK